MTFEPSLRWSGAPQVCEATNFLAFVSPADWADFDRSNGGHAVVLASWRCRRCLMWHFIVGEPGDSSGGFRARARTIPAYAEKIMRETALPTEN